MRDYENRVPQRAWHLHPTEAAERHKRAITNWQAGIASAEELETRNFKTSGLVIGLTYKEAMLDGLCLLKF